jgi:hypothetical protein
VRDQVAVREQLPAIAQGFMVWVGRLGLMVSGLEVGLWALGFGVWGLRFGVSGLRFGGCWLGFRGSSLPEIETLAHALVDDLEPVVRHRQRLRCGVCDRESQQVTSLSSCRPPYTGIYSGMRARAGGDRILRFRFSGLGLCCSLCRL